MTVQKAKKSTQITNLAELNRISARITLTQAIQKCLNGCSFNDRMCFLN